MSPAVVLFAREPEAGRPKTPLSADLGEEAALRFRPRGPGGPGKQAWRAAAALERGPDLAAVAAAAASGGAPRALATLRALEAA